jgi:signal transduction histidine kinase
LHPPLLDERGLNAALRWFVEGFSERSGIEVAVEIDPDFPRLSDQLEMTIFRVLQESLSNVRRHAQSKTAHIRLALVEGSVQLEIHDSGRGIRQAEAEGLGVGIAGMRERLLQLGGSLRIISNNPGTAVIARFPQIL